MGTRALIVLVISIMTSCVHPKTQEEMFDYITTTIYTNNYDDKCKLLFVDISKREEENTNGKYVLKNVNNSLKEYKYLDDGVFEISETSDQSPCIISTTVTGQNSDKYYSTKNDIDTLYYIYAIYLDKAKSTPKYNRHVWNSALNDDADKNYESHYYYDDKGKNTKIVEHNFITGEMVETQIFYNLLYEEAVKLVPKIKNIQIACRFEKEKGDTIITQYQLNGETTYYEKEYKDADKIVKAKFDSNSRLIEKDINYKEHGFDVEIKEISDLELIDSTYYIAGKEIRRVSVYPDSKTIVTSEYDDMGNIKKKVEKSIITVTEKDINEMLRIIQESKK